MVSIYQNTLNFHLTISLSHSCHHYHFHINSIVTLIVIPLIVSVSVFLDFTPHCRGQRITLYYYLKHFSHDDNSRLLESGDCVLLANVLLSTK